MRIYLSVDMEGLAGVAHPHQVVFGLNGIDRTDYDRSRALMAGETNAAIEAAFQHGAARGRRQRQPLADAEPARGGPACRCAPHHRRQAVQHDAGDRRASATGRSTAAAFIGYHAGAGHPTGVIAHTYSSATVLEIRANGVPHNEAGLNAIRLGHHGVPVMLVAGDDALATEVEALLPWAERVIVKRALGSNVADSLSPADAQQAIREGMARALARMGEMRLYEPAHPIAGEIDFRLPAMADYACVVPGDRADRPANGRLQRR